MRNFQGIMFIRGRVEREIFKYALVCTFKEHSARIFYIFLTKCYLIVMPEDTYDFLSQEMCLFIIFSIIVRKYFFYMDNEEATFIPYFM